MFRISCFLNTKIFSSSILSGMRGEAHWRMRGLLPERASWLAAEQNSDRWVGSWAQSMDRDGSRTKDSALRRQSTGLFLWASQSPVCGLDQSTQTCRVSLPTGRIVGLGTGYSLWFPSVLNFHNFMKIKRKKKCSWVHLPKLICFLKTKQIRPGFVLFTSLPLICQMTSMNFWGIEKTNFQIIWSN